VRRSNRVCIETSSCVDGEELKGGQWDDKLNKTIVHRNGRQASGFGRAGSWLLGCDFSAKGGDTSSSVLPTNSNRSYDD
jgi:hypothetical protein